MRGRKVQVYDWQKEDSTVGSACMKVFVGNGYLHGYGTNYIYDYDADGNNSCMQHSVSIVESVAIVEMEDGSIRRVRDDCILFLDDSKVKDDEKVAQGATMEDRQRLFGSRWVRFYQDGSERDEMKSYLAKYKCGACGFLVSDIWRYCPMCGYTIIKK